MCCRGFGSVFWLGLLFGAELVRAELAGGVGAVAACSALTDSAEYLGDPYNQSMETMKSFSPRPLLALLSSLAMGTASADLQIGLGGGAFRGSEYDEQIGYGLEGEVGFLAQSQPVNLFFGVRASYVDGLESAGSLYSAKDSSELGLFEGAAVARLLFPLGTEMVKIYGEGSVGSANLKVSGDARVKGSIGGQDYSINSRFDESDWALALGLGAGLQFDFTPMVGWRLGYNFHSFGDSEVFGLKLDSGAMHGFTSAVVLKF